MGQVHVEAWRQGYAHIFPSSYLDSLDPEERGEVWESRIADGTTEAIGVDPEQPGAVTLVGELDGEVLSFGSYGPYRPVDDQTPADARAEAVSELWGINVHPDAWGTGLAQAMMATLLSRLATEHPEPTAILWVLADNARGRRFYDKVGWAPDGRTTTLEQAGLEIPELRYAIDLSPYR